MTKQDFLEKLRFALSGKVNPEVVTDNINYYEDYINMEIRKGRSEKEVLEALGDPRLIARTIAETNPSQAGGKGGGYVDGEQGGRGGEPYGTSSGFKLSGLPLWVWPIVAIVVAALVISAVFSILSMVLPILLPILVILFLVKLFRDWIQ